MRIFLRVLLLAGLALPLAAQTASKAKVPALLESGRYVAFAYDVGSGFVYAEQISAVADQTLPEERQAMEAIRTDVEKWGRYAVTNRHEQANLLIVVRKGRHGSVEAGAGRGGPANTPGGAGRGFPSLGSVSGQLSSGEDRLDVYEVTDGRPGIRLWSGAGTNGLAGSSPRLYKSFREEVEESSKKP